MSSWTAEIRRRAAIEKREQRDARQRQRELDRCLKEQAKLSEQERARLEVETHENALTVLLSVHKEQSAPIDWQNYAAALPPVPPAASKRHEFSAMLKFGVAACTAPEGNAMAAAEVARMLDQRELQTAKEEYDKATAEWERMRALAKRVLAGDAAAYGEAILEFSSLGEVESIGSSIRAIVRGPKLLECTLTVNGRQTLPQEMKSLTTSGKLSVKPMPKLRAHEIYQDYVCGCALRVAREMLALLPVNQVLVTASVSEAEPQIGSLPDCPVLSVAVDRATIEQLDFERLDPSDSMDRFAHRGDAMLSRNAGRFTPIVPLSASDLPGPESPRKSLAGLLETMRALRAEIDAQLSPSPSEGDQNASQTSGAQ